MPFLFGYNQYMFIFNFDRLSDPLFWRSLACMIPVMLLSLTVHEWGHAFAAHKCGDDTARNLGRMTLNPLRHIDPIGFLMILLVGFGWAKPVPVNPRNYRNYKTGEAIVSLAGVCMNLICMLVFSVLYVIFLCLLIKEGYQWLTNGLLLEITAYGIVLNCSLAVFNLLPFYPLDGYHIFELIFGRVLPIRVFLFLRRYGQFILIGILLIFRLIQFYPIQELAGLLIGGLGRLAFNIVF